MKALKWPIRGNSGYSLTEVMVTAVIISIALVPMLGVIAEYTARTSAVDDKMLANTLAQELAEELRKNFASAESSSTLVNDFKTNIKNTYGFDANITVTTVVLDKIKKVKVLILKSNNQLAVLEFNVHK